MGLKNFFCSKNLQKSAAGGDTFEYTNFLNTSPKLDIFAF